LYDSKLIKLCRNSSNGDYSNTGMTRSVILVNNEKLFMKRSSMHVEASLPSCEKQETFKFFENSAETEQVKVK